MIAVVDYGASNMTSVLRALRAVGSDVAATADPEAVRRGDRVVVPGVGHFAPARQRLEETGLGDAIVEAARAGRPVLGICLGLQLFLDYSEEAPGLDGLGLLAGRAVRFTTSLPVPHVGWAKVLPTEHGASHPVLRAAMGGGEAYFYHVHSYHPEQVPTPVALAQAEYGAPFATIMGRDNVLGVQFHPEKSQAAGLGLLRAFTAWSP